MSLPQAASLSNVRSSWLGRTAIMLLATVIWSLAMGASAWLNLSHWVTEERFLDLVALFTLGAMPAVPLTMAVLRFTSRWRLSKEQRFALSFLLMAVLTIGCTALLFSQFYRLMYVEWHAESLSRIWFWQFIFTTASAFYQFAVLGLQLYFPAGFATLFLLSLWLTARVR